jgi:hypothetical protein
MKFEEKLALLQTETVKGFVRLEPFPGSITLSKFHADQGRIGSENKEL